MSTQLWFLKFPFSQQDLGDFYHYVSPHQYNKNECILTCFVINNEGCWSSWHQSCCHHHHHCHDHHHHHHNHYIININKITIDTSQPSNNAGNSTVLTSSWNQWSWRHYITLWSPGPWQSSSSTTASISSPLTDGVINTGDWHCAGGTSYPFLASSLSSPSSSSPSPSTSLSFIIIIGDHDHNCPQPLKWSINHHINTTYPHLSAISQLTDSATINPKPCDGVTCCWYTTTQIHCNDLYLLKHYPYFFKKKGPKRSQTCTWNYTSTHK